MNLIASINNPYIHFNNSNITFESSLLTKAERANLSVNFENKMATHTDNVQMLYKYGLEFIKNKINKEEFLFKMFDLIQNTKGDKWGNLNKKEDKYIGQYGVFFDINGLDDKKMTKSTIMDFFKILL